MYFLFLFKWPETLCLVLKQQGHKWLFPPCLAAALKPGPAAQLEAHAPRVIVSSTVLSNYIQYICVRGSCMHACGRPAVDPVPCAGPYRVRGAVGAWGLLPYIPLSGSVDPIVSCVTTRRPANKGRLAPSLNIAANLKPTIRADSFTSAQWGDKDGALGGIEGRKKFTLACRVPRERDRTQLRRSRSCGKLPIWFRLINMMWS